MGGVSAQRIKGKLKREIADEAFQKLGANATIPEVDAYFKKHYGLVMCERSMYTAAKRRAQGYPTPVPRRYRRNKEQNVVGIICRVKELAREIGSWEELEELIRVLK